MFLICHGFKKSQWESTKSSLTQLNILKAPKHYINWVYTKVSVYKTRNLMKVICDDDEKMSHHHGKQIVLEGFPDTNPLNRIADKIK